MKLHLKTSVLFFLLSIPLYSIKTLELNLDKTPENEYSLVLKTRMLNKLEVSWQGQFETPIQLDQPLNFKIKSTNGTLICHLLLTQKSAQYLLSYTFEAIVEPENAEKIFYMKKKGETRILLNEYIHISPWADIKHSSQKWRKILKDGSVKHYDKRDYSKSNQTNSKDEIILSFLVKKLE